MIHIASRVWGPVLWNFLHVITLKYSYNSISKDIIVNLFDSLTYIIPCSLCRKHYAKNIKEYSIKPKENVVQWLIDLHNIINKQLLKQQIDNVMAMEHLNIIQQNNYNKEFIKVLQFILSGLKDRIDYKVSINISKFIRSSIYFMDDEIIKNKINSELHDFNDKCKLKKWIHELELLINIQH